MDTQLCFDNNNLKFSISFQPIEPKYNEFLLKVFIESRQDLAYINGFGENQKMEIVFQQFMNEQEQLIKQYPKAEFNIVMLNKKPIGRFYIYYGDTIDHIMEIGLLEEYRGLGIGKRIITEVIENAIEKKKSIDLQVAWFNQSAYIFYEKLGFKVIEDNFVFKKMQYTP